MNKIKFKILKRNRAYFRIAIIQNDSKKIADLAIDDSTLRFETGQEIEGYLMKQKVNPKSARKCAFEKYKFSSVAIKVKPDIFVSFNIESFRYEIKCKAKYSNVCEKHNFTWNRDNNAWHTYSERRVLKAIQSFENQGLKVSNDYVGLMINVIRVETYKASKRDQNYTENSRIYLSEAAIDKVVAMLQSKNRICAGFYWKSEYAKYKRFEYKNGGLFGTHNKVTLQNYRQQFKTREYVRRVCHGFDCKTVEQLLTRL
ncbi:hypothetical protein ND973_14480 [Vibrio diabolicus]|uniref:hypothetical protein n=1 Tax=Vibrio sp. Vb0599 TaxID=3074628 RepID=UPI0021CE581D|nr:hypothetical protein [Vibrio sp. Vb0599]MCS0328320.1 hypothetical protein [Vibrio diabolicus]MDW1941491.1 hypothetical protein [Vibrio sp. Vb0599]